MKWEVLKGCGEPHSTTTALWECFLELKWTMDCSPTSILNSLRFVVKQTVARSRSRSRELVFILVRQRESLVTEGARGITKTAIEYRSDGTAGRSEARSPHNRRRTRSSERKTRNKGKQQRDSRSPHDRRKRDAHTREPIPLDEIVNCERDVAALMDFTGFNTTKNEKVQVNHKCTVKIKKTRRYRHYMNRKGEFNHPLDYIA